MKYEEKIKIFDFINKKGIGAEVGVHEGDFSSYIIDYVQPKKLFLIDPWITQNKPGSWYDKKVISESEMDQRYERVVKKFSNNNDVVILRKKSENIGNLIDANSLDFAYIDGDHSYESVCKDFDIFYEKLRPGGYLLGDDYFVGKWWGDSIIRAVDYNLEIGKFMMIKTLGSQFCLKVLKTHNENN